MTKNLNFALKIKGVVGRVTHVKSLERAIRVKNQTLICHTSISLAFSKCSPPKN